MAAAFIDIFIEGGLFDLFDQEPVWSLLCKLQWALSYNEETDAYEVPDPPYRRIEECTGWTPEAWVLLSDAYRRVQDRVPALKASWLERFGESKLATMLVERPALYHHWVLAPELCTIVPPGASRRR